MSAPTKPQTRQAQIPPPPGPEVKAVRSLPSGYLYVRDAHAVLAREWRQHTGFMICRTYESWQSLCLLSPGGVEDATKEWAAERAATPSQSTNSSGDQ